MTHVTTDDFEQFVKALNDRLDKIETAIRTEQVARSNCDAALAAQINLSVAQAAAKAQLNEPTVTSAPSIYYGFGSGWQAIDLKSPAEQAVTANSEELICDSRHYYLSRAEELSKLIGQAKAQKNEDMAQRLMEEVALLKRKALGSL